ncbi:hypothetical protein PUN4_50025 [Paraburkholderia unamae]|nr:hypothetical protein PUN4_50025 [Paraburkholderia unamae]
MFHRHGGCARVEAIVVCGLPKRWLRYMNLCKGGPAMSYRHQTSPARTGDVLVLVGAAFAAPGARRLATRSTPYYVVAGMRSPKPLLYGAPHAPTGPLPTLHASSGSPVAAAE